MVFYSKKENMATGAVPPASVPFHPFAVGAVVYRDEPVELRPGLRRETLLVRHTGDRPIQVGSHYHFFEVNRALQFDRARAFGMHLDIPSGTAVRFEPGEEKEVTLVTYGGKGRLIGFNGLTMGEIGDPAVRAKAMERARNAGYVPDAAENPENGGGN